MVDDLDFWHFPYLFKGSMGRALLWKVLAAGQTLSPSFPFDISFQLTATVVHEMKCMKKYMTER